MEYIDALNEVKNNLIDLVNENKISNSKISDSFKKYDLNIQFEYANLADLVENVKHDFLNTFLSSISIFISYNGKDDLEFIYYLCVFLFVYSGYTFIDEAREYYNSINKCNDIQNDMDICKLESKVLNTKNELLDIEINKINIAIDFLNSLTEEEKVKYLN